MSGAACRYARQIRVDGFGAEGQRRLARARVGIVGVGALGSRVAEDLGRAGIGYLRLIDRDWIELSNLHRQHLYDEADALNEEPKALAAARRLTAINSEIELAPQLRDLGPLEVDELLGDLDIVIDGTDNFQTRYLVNDFCVRNGTPWIYGACVSSQGMVAPFLPNGACLRCVFPAPPPASTAPTCETAGILPPAAAFVTAMQCMLALRILATDTPPDCTLTTIDILTGDLRSMRLPPMSDPDCPACGRGEFPALDPAGASRTKRLCGRNAVQLSAAAASFPPLAELAVRLQAQFPCELSPHMLRVQIPEGKISVFRGGRAIVQGTQDEGRARALFDRYIGS